MSGNDSQDTQPVAPAAVGVAKQQVIFIYVTAQRGLGSRLLRCDQMCEIGNRYLGDKYEFSTQEMVRGRPRQQRHAARRAVGAILIFLKYAARKIDPLVLGLLRSRAAGLCIDYIDMPAMPDGFVYYDTHIAASPTEHQRLQATFARLSSSQKRPSAQVAFLTHGPDTRIQRQTHARRPFQIGYLGLEVNRALPETLEGNVDCLAYDPRAEMEPLLEQLSTYPMHYAVREKPYPGMPTKPFTKGMVAAAMGANILVNREVADAEYYLGKDYPYLIDGTDETAIREGIRKAQEEYGSAEWERGLEAMRALREATGPESIARELGAILERFL